MNDFMKRICRLRERLGPELPPVTLIYANGERRSMAALEAFDAVVSEHSIVSAESQDKTSTSFFMALIESATDDFDDLEELR